MLVSGQVSASEMTYIVSSGALNSTHSRTGVRTFVRTFRQHGAMVNRSLRGIFFPEIVSECVRDIFSRRSVCRIFCPRAALVIGVIHTAAPRAKRF